MTGPGTQCFLLGGAILDEQQHVLSIPDRYVPIVPDQRANQIKNGIVMALESFRPVLWRLLIDVMHPLLTRQCGREQDQIGMSDAIVHHDVSKLCIDVLGDFQTHDKIIPLVQVEPLAEIGG